MARLHLANNIREKKRSDLERGDLSGDEIDSRSILVKDPNFAGSNLRHVEAANLLAVVSKQVESSSVNAVEFYAKLEVLNLKTGKKIYKRVIF